jgi:hypothetical protein
MAFMWGSAATRPIGACHLARDGRWTVGAAGATNTSGVGGPLLASSGLIPQDAANRHVISIEAANAGTGEPWPLVQQQSYVLGVAALCRAYGLLTTFPDVHAHHEWTSRKVDPAGESRYAAGSAKWDMGLFRADVAEAIDPPPPPSTGDTVNFIAPSRVVDTRVWPGVPLEAGREYTFGMDPNVVPKAANGFFANLTALGAGVAGFVTVWPDGPRPATSTTNYDAAGTPSNGPVACGLTDAHTFKVLALTRCHLILDVTAWS